MEIIILIVEKIVEYTIAPIGRQLSYFFLYNRNIKNLRVRHQDLLDAREEVQHRVDVEKNRGCEIEPMVSTWLRRVDDTITKLPNNMSQENESGLDNPSCFNVVQRYQRSSKARKKGKEISKLMENKKNFKRVGYLVPLSGFGRSNIVENYQFLESRRLMAKQIKDGLANPNFNRIGLFGMGGVGKTTFLDEVEKLVLEDKLFNQVIKVTLGQTLNVEDIQAQMGDKLRLELRTAESKQGRADLLQNKLKMEKKILVIFDDLWNKLDLKDIGIPCRSKLSENGSKILITSRKRNVLTKEMDVEKYFQLNHLSEEESWKFFSTIVGEFDKAAIENVAKKVAKKCGGLPLALVGVAKALKGEKIEIWKDALNRLKNPIPAKIEGVTDLLYSSIKLSYDHIKSTETWLLFLLCSVFPDDYEISAEGLQMYAMGMRLLSEVHTWCEARNRVIKLVDDLISSSLLLQSNLRDKYVKMHDVVRDVAIYIASSIEANMSTLNFVGHSEWPENDRCGSYRAIFGNLANFHYLPQSLEFRNLELLILHGGSNTLQISNTFFRGMEKLTILNLSRMVFQELRISLTHTLVENLQVFCMDRCMVNDIDIIDELKKLKILRIKYCQLITYLPPTMSKLTELKVLEVSNCERLNVIPPNVFSSMTKLEELDLSSSFGRWGEVVSYENKLIKNVTLQGLKYLPHLISLKLDILDEKMLQDLLFLENLKLENFEFNVGVKDFRHMMFGEQSEFSRTLLLTIGSEVDLIDRVFGTLWQRCECLCIEEASEGLANFRFKSNENGLPSLSQANPENDDPFFDDEVPFPELRHLKIVGGNNWKRVWDDHGLIANSFCKLQIIEFSKFYSSRYIFSSNVVAALVSLNSLRIEECELLERIFEMEKPTFKEKENAKVMPLKKLYLKGLLNLKCVWNKDPSAFLTFPNLQEIKVLDCPQLQSLFPATFINHVQKLESLNVEYWSKGVPLQLFSEDKTLKLVFPEIVFPSLTTLKLGTMAMTESLWFRSAWFPRLRYLSLDYDNNDDIIGFPREMNQIFYNIEILSMYSSSQLIQVFPNEEENNNHTQRSCANLKQLNLYSLPELRHVWTDSSGVSLMIDNLEELYVYECGKLKCIAPPSITFLNLRDLHVSGCHKLRNLLSSSSMAKTLVQIIVYECREMTCIFAGEEEEDKHEIAFSKLECLIIESLPRLESFYLGKCRLVFPCLKELKVDECPTMKIFSHGTVSTPKLEHLKMNGSEVLYHSKHDINDIFQDNYCFES